MQSCFLLQGALLKVAARTKSTTIRQVLSGRVILNSHQLHSEFLKSNRMSLSLWL